MANSGKGSSGGAGTAAKNAAEQAKKVAPKAAAVTVPPAAAQTDTGRQGLESGRTTAANSMPSWLPAGLDGALVFDVMVGLAFLALIYAVIAYSPDNES